MPSSSSEKHRHSVSNTSRVRCPLCMLQDQAHLVRIQDNALVLPALNVLERQVEMLPAGLDGRRLLLVTRQVGVDELNETVEVLGGDLGRVSWVGKEREAPM